MSPLRTHILDVGRGDSIIIELPSKNSERVIGIIDCYIYEKTKQYLENNGIQPDRVQFVVATHPHRDHVLGIKKLLNMFKTNGVQIQLFLDSGYENNPIPSYIDLTKYLLDNSDSIVTSYVRTGSVFDLGKVKLRVLSPPEPLVKGTRSDCNNSSIVISLRYGRAKLFFAADAELPNWANICVNQRHWMRAQVLKVSHHGSKWGTFFEALDTIKPRYAIISGENSLSDLEGGFPHPLIKRALEEVKTNIYCTHDHGDIQISSQANGSHTITHSRNPN